MQDVLTDMSCSDCPGGTSYSSYGGGGSSYSSYSSYGGEKDKDK